MKNLQDIIQEKLQIGSKSKISQYKYHPKNWNELKVLLKRLLSERGKDADLNDIDISKITNMARLFIGLDPHNIDISKWNVSNVTNMGDMFDGCKNFDSDLSEWDVSNVKDMDGMFYLCKNFNSDLSEWDVSKVKNMRFMFNGSRLEKNPPKWYK